VGFILTPLRGFVFTPLALCSYTACALLLRRFAVLRYATSRLWFDAAWSFVLTPAAAFFLFGCPALVDGLVPI
jgi:hypothetical protein